MMSIRQQARKFAVWRMGTLRNWGCSYAEVAAATGIPLTQVRRICLAAGWRFQQEPDRLEPVDSYMTADNHVDVPETQS